jgi:GNAT superfamily N-acetyltransferase
MTTHISYRHPISEDMDAVAKLCGELGYPSSPQAVADRLEQFIDHEDHLVIVAAEDPGEPVGWIHAFLAHRLESDTFAEIGGMVVAEGHRSMGIGATLLQKTEAWARLKGVPAIRVRSNIVRERAHRFYLCSGYSQGKTAHIFEKVFGG